MGRPTVQQVTSLPKKQVRTCRSVHFEALNSPLHLTATSGRPIFPNPCLQYSTPTTQTISMTHRVLLTSIHLLRAPHIQMLKHLMFENISSSTHEV
ncbi:CLUMA_CG003504, isoform A [Clunio marinus]|uniref:CLUMA_CG003504, isoform A n=1 Tax=Clunio marinus TaxID=568069 RepID=A0A1J1HQK7_9DIPT|nr:CLUMA_CG003504, isoform A [Clunio marinus]